MKLSTKRTYLNRKTARPFSSQHAMHVVMRSDVARGDFSLLRKETRSWLRLYLPRVARQFSVKLYSNSNNGNHIHLVIRASDKKQFASFLRVLSGMIARKVLGAERGREKGIKFWSSRPYSRLVTWGREFWSVLRYVERNILEARGSFAYLERRRERDPMREVLAGRTFLNQRDLMRSEGEMKFKENRV